MVFNSLHFVWFFLVVYAAYRVLPHRAQNWLLLVASYYFYAAWDWRFLGAADRLDAGRLHAAGWRSTGLTPRARRRLLLCVSLGFNLTLLGFFKYFNFFADNLHAMFGALGWQLDFVTLRVLLPIGISFYTFVTMSYVIDVYRREIPPTRNLLDFAVFVAYFPHLVAGPILRASRLLPQIDAPRHGHARAGARRRCGSSRGGSSRRSSSPTTWPASPTWCSTRRATTPASTSCSASTRSRFRSTATSPATPTSRAARRS